MPNIHHTIQAAFLVCLGSTSLIANDANTTTSLIAPGAKVIQVATGFTFTEGPACDQTGNIYFSDIPHSRIYKWSTDGVLTTHRENTGRSNGLYFDKHGNLLACEGGNRRVVSITPDGKLEVLVKEYGGRKLNSPNDLWVDPHGGIYFTDPRYGGQDTVEQNGFHVYYIPPGTKKVIRVIDDLKKPNGIIGTTDGRRLYITDTIALQTYVYQILPGGSVTNRKVMAPQGSDGMTLDEQGNLYLTRGPGVQIYAPDGEKIAELPVPEGTTNVTFGGINRRTLFITAHTSLYSIQMNVPGQKP